MMKLFAKIIDHVKLLAIFENGPPYMLDRVLNSSLCMIKICLPVDLFFPLLEANVFWQKSYE